jgi:hypothetical protein
MTLWIFVAALGLTLIGILIWYETVRSKKETDK